MNEFKSNERVNRIR